MLTPVTTKQFQKDVKKAKKQGKEIDKLKKIMTLLLNELSLSVKNKDHKLSGNYSQHRECHISPDWLLIFKTTKTELIFERAGSHSELFKK
jgi:mRNA interferase YafQ